MTQQVRTSYRHHRKATWALALAVVAAIATVVIPFASGAAPKYYILTASPEAICFTGAGQTQQFTLQLFNDSRNNTLGSAEITAPSFITLTPGTLGGDAPVGSSLVGQVIKLRNLPLPTQGSSVTVTVSATINAASPGTWTSVAKQSNNFSDAGPGNLFTSRGDPPLTVSACRLEFVTQPPNPWEKDTAVSPPVEVAVLSGTTRVAVSGTPLLTAGGAGSIGNFSGTSASYDASTTSWKWTGLKPTANALSGLYNLTATLGSMTDTSDSNATTAGDQPFRVTDNNCLSGEICNVTSNLGGPQSQVGISNTLPGSIAIDFSDGDDAYDANGNPKCANWNRAYYTDGTGTHYFPGVVLDFAWGDNMLKLVYRVRNSEWTLTNVARGNNDIEFCAGARHWEDVQRGGDGDYAKVKVNGVDTWVRAPFLTKSGALAQWNSQDKLYWGVLATVSNATKVKTDPAVCARGTQDLQTGANNTYETWRTWTICIPFDWDWKNFG